MVRNRSSDDVTLDKQSAGDLVAPEISDVVVDSGDVFTVPFLAREIEHVPIDSIVAHPANPNVGDVGAIGESIDTVGFYSTVYVQQSTGMILAGEHRWRALRERGASSVPVVRLDVDDETALRILIADNEIPRRTSQPDDGRLAELLTDLATQTPAGLSGTGFDGDALDRLLGDLGPPPTGVAGGGAKPITSGVMFRFGDYSGWLSEAVYDRFRDAYEQQRAESGEVILDDVFAVWLGV